MKRFFGVFVLTPAEQRIVIVLVLLLVLAAWHKHHRDLDNIIRPQSKPQGAAVSTPPN